MAKNLGRVDLLGLNAFGVNPGLNPIYGTLIGGGTAGVVGMLAKKWGTPGGFLERNDQLVGFGAGVAVSAAMFSMKSTRHAAWGSLVGAFLTSGFHVLADMLTGSRGMHKSEKLDGLGIAQINALNGLGIPEINQLPGVAGMNGLGIAEMSNLAPPAGLGIASMSDLTKPIGVAGPQLGNPRLLGPSLVGSSSLSAAYGATLLGGGRR